MIDLGRYRLGEWVPIAFSGTSAAATPTLPDSQPTITIWDASDVSSSVATISPPIRDRYKITALFTHWIRLSSTYSTGKTYIADCSAVVGGVTFRTQIQWETIAGGSTDGNVIGAVFVDRPEARQIVYQLDGGKLQARRNPG